MESHSKCGLTAARSCILLDIRTLRPMMMIQEYCVHIITVLFQSLFKLKNKTLTLQRFCCDVLFKLTLGSPH